MLIKKSYLTGIDLDQPSKCILNDNALSSRATILKRILDANVEREIQALYALQALITRLEHPNSK